MSSPLEQEVAVLHNSYFLHSIMGYLKRSSIHRSMNLHFWRTFYQGKTRNPHFKNRCPNFCLQVFQIPRPILKKSISHCQIINIEHFLRWISTHTFWGFLLQSMSEISVLLFFFFFLERHEALEQETEGKVFDIFVLSTAVRISGE